MKIPMGTTIANQKITGSYCFYKKGMYLCPHYKNRRIMRRSIFYINHSISSPLLNCGTIFEGGGGISHLTENRIYPFREPHAANRPLFFNSPKIILFAKQEKPFFSGSIGLPVCEQESCHHAIRRTGIVAKSTSLA